MTDNVLLQSPAQSQVKLYNIVQEIQKIRGCDYKIANKSWRNFKYENKGIQPVLNLVRLKTLTSDGKMRLMDHCDGETLSRIIVLMPSKQLDDAKQAIAIKAVRNQGKVARRGLTDVYQSRGIQGMEYAMLTNEEYKGIYGMTRKQIAKAKGLGDKENIRDNMSHSELALTCLLECMTTEMIEKSNAQGYYEVKKVVQDAASATTQMREIYEKKLNKSIITPKHLLK